jgi:hypothetical protein
MAPIKKKREKVRDYVCARWDISKRDFFSAGYSSLSRRIYRGAISCFVAQRRFCLWCPWNRSFATTLTWSLLLFSSTTSTYPNSEKILPEERLSCWWIVAFFFIVLRFYGPHFMRAGNKKIKRKKKRKKKELFTFVCQNRFPTPAAASS